MTKYTATEIDRSPIEYTTIRAFGHEFKHLLPGIAEMLITLEKEGALYLDLFDGETGRSKHYRLKLLPQEIVRYVEGSVAISEGQRHHTPEERQHTPDQVHFAHVVFFFHPDKELNSTHALDFDMLLRLMA